MLISNYPSLLVSEDAPEMECATKTNLQVCILGFRDDECQNLVMDYSDFKKKCKVAGNEYTCPYLKRDSEKSPVDDLGKKNRRKIIELGVDLYQVESASHPGTFHVVDTAERSCDCKGFQFRGDCSHLRLALEEKKPNFQPSEV